MGMLNPIFYPALHIKKHEQLKELAFKFTSGLAYSVSKHILRPENKRPVFVRMSVKTFLAGEIYAHLLLESKTFSGNGFAHPYSVSSPQQLLYCAIYPPSTSMA